MASEGFIVVIALCPHSPQVCSGLFETEEDNFLTKNKIFLNTYDCCGCGYATALDAIKIEIWIAIF